jgi:hypothetical protein
MRDILIFQPLLPKGKMMDFIAVDYAIIENH